MPETVLSRLARSTELSKTESRSAGAVRIQSRRTRYKSESDCPRNLTNIPCCAKPCQREYFTEFPRDFHSGNSSWRTGDQNLGAKAMEFDGFSGTTNVMPFPGSCSFRSAQRYGLPLRKRSIR